jgi:hypothetical protein
MTPRPGRKRPTFTLARLGQWLIWPAVLISASGCAFLAYVASQMGPPQKVKAVYELPEDKRVLVFVDDYGNPDESIVARDLKRRLTQNINEQFEKHEVVSETVPYSEVVRVQGQTPNFRSLHTEEVGDKVDADIVVYVHIDQFSLRDPDSQRLWHGRLKCSLKVLDVEKGMAGRGGHLWPHDKDLYDAEGKLKVNIPAESETSPTYGEVLTSEMIEEMAGMIGRVFRDHEIRSSDVTWENAKKQNGDT